MAWPGLRPDVAERWRSYAREQRRGVVSREVVDAETLPASARNRPVSKRAVSERVQQIAEQLAAGKPIAATPSNMVLGRRSVLAKGQQRSRPNHHLLAQALRYVPNGRDTFVGSILRAARNGDTDAQAWMTVYEHLLEAERQDVDFDDICEACGVTPDRLMAIVVSTVMRAGSDIADFVSAVYHPEIVRQTARSAMRIGGQFANVAQKDREMFLQHMKFIEGPRGVSVNVNATAEAKALSAAQTAPSVPTFAQSVLGAQRSHSAVQRAVVEALPPATEEETWDPMSTPASSRSLVGSSS